MVSQNMAEGAAGTLYVVGTPIGNLEDFTLRAVNTLKECNFIAAEDSRVTLKLLNHLNISKKIVSYHEHNRVESGKKIIERLLAGESCALTSDAGMPAISDPGRELVASCREQGIPVVVLPGPCALITAYVGSGIGTGRFTFEGFLSVNKKSRKEHLESLKNEERTMIFYEAPHKLQRTLADMLEALGDRRVILARELTKIYEEYISTTLDKASQRYESENPRGEFVIVVEGKAHEAQIYSLEYALALAKDFIGQSMTLSAAAAAAAAATNIKKSEIYSALISERSNQVENLDF